MANYFPLQAVGIQRPARSFACKLGTSANKRAAAAAAAERRTDAGAAAEIAFGRMATDGDGAIVGLAEEAAKERLRVYNDQAEGGARQIFIDPNATIKRYMHAAAELIRQGKECASEGDTDRAYVMLLRFTIFYLERLPEHPNFKAAPEKKALTKECLAALDQVEELKKELLARFAVEEADRIVTERQALAEAQAAAAAAAEAQAAAEAEAAREAGLQF